MYMFHRTIIFALLFIGLLLSPIVVSSVPDTPTASKITSSMSEDVINKLQDLWEAGKYADAENILLELRKSANENSKSVINKVLADLYHDWAIILINHGQIKEALLICQKALDENTELNDKQGVTLTLCIFATAYDSVSDYKNSMKYHQKALGFAQNIGDKKTEEDQLLNIGDVYNDLAQYDKSLEYYQKSLAIAQEIRDKVHEEMLIGDIGGVYYELAQYEKALLFFQNAIAMAKEISDKVNEEKWVGNIGLVYTELVQYSKALEYFQKALDLAKAIGNKASEGKWLEHIGTVYAHLSHYAKALEFEKIALELIHKNGTKMEEGDCLFNIGILYSELSQYEKALEYFNKALVLTKNIENKRSLEAEFDNMGILYMRLSKYVKALEYYQTALILAKQTRDKKGEEICNSNIGMVYSIIGQYDKSLKYYQNSLLIQKEISDQSSEAYTLNNLMVYYELVSKHNLAIFYGKQSVNIKQSIRSNIRNINKDLQQSYLQANIDTYRTLADLLISLGRISEALQVLHLLKEKEYFDYVHSEQQNIGGNKLTPLEYYGIELKWNRNIEDAGNNVETAQKSVDDLEKLKKEMGEGFGIENEHNLENAKAKLETAEKEFISVFKDMEADKSGDAKISTNETGELQRLQNIVRQAGSNSILINTIVADDRYIAIMTTSSGQKVYTYNISSSSLYKKINHFRITLTSPNLDPRPNGKELYNILIKPMLSELEKNHVKTILWSLDDALRYIPINALWDGKHYMVEKYRNVVYTIATGEMDSAKSKQDIKGLGVGSSQEQTVTEPITGDKQKFDALPGVKKEVLGIFHAPGDPAGQGVVNGKHILDNQVTQKSLRNELDGKYNVVHIASHFALSATDSTSYLLLGDGTVWPVSDLRTHKDLFKGVNLLTLSACDTAVDVKQANGKEIEGFGVLVQKQGAKSVIASLWPVDDTVAPVFMKRFYQDQIKGMSKAEALQKTQIDMIHGVIGFDKNMVGKRRAKLTPMDKTETNFVKYMPNAKAPYSHPYYWAPFILIGNWK